MKRYHWWEPELTGGELDNLKAVLDSNFLNDGEVTAEFEKKLEELLNVKHVVTVTNGTAALFSSIKALDISHGDEVIIPNITFIATANAVTWAGAKPVLVDVDGDTLNIDPEKVRNAITEKTRAVIPVHVSGRPANLDEISELCRDYGLHIIEDAAEGLLSSYKGKYLGTIGDLGCLSFSPNKTITTGQGGAILTNDDALYNRLIEIKDQGRPKRGTGGDDIHNSVGYNFKFTNLQSAIGLAQLTKVVDRVRRLQRHYDIYKKSLKEVGGIRLLPFDIASGEVPQWIDAVCENRDELVNTLLKNGMHSRKFWLPINTQKPYKLDSEQFKVSLKMNSKCLWLPSAFTLNDRDIIEICNVIKKFYK